MNFVYENNIEIYETYDIVDEECRDSYLNDNLTDLANGLDWRQLLSVLRHADENSGYDYYVYDDWSGGYRGIDDSDIDEIKDYVLEIADEDDVWEPEDEDESSDAEPEAVVEDPDDFELEEEDITILDLFTSSVQCMVEVPSESL